jgi:anaerobic magnesium-protoporphyrin IX monomethyl ester cyclase
MKILLTHAYFIQEDPKERQIMKPYPPLGILYLSSYLCAKGFAVEIYDSTFGSRVPDIE